MFVKCTSNSLSMSFPSYLILQILEKHTNHMFLKTIHWPNDPFSQDVPRNVKRLIFLLFLTFHNLSELFTHFHNFTQFYSFIQHSISFWIGFVRFSVLRYSDYNSAVSFFSVFSVLRLSSPRPSIPHICYFFYTGRIPYFILKKNTPKMR